MLLKAHTVEPDVPQPSSQGHYHKVFHLHRSDLPMMSKMLLIFCDGAGTDGNLSDGIEDGLKDGRSGKQYATNVLRLSRAIKNQKNRTGYGRRQIVFYQAGVGREANFKGDPVMGTTAIQVFGTAVANKVRDAYAFIAQNFDEGDEICIFGFSTGAYIARKLSGLIDQVGLLDYEQLGYFFEIWKELVDGKTPRIPIGTRTNVHIKCVGLWDTTSPVLGTIDALKIKDTSLPSRIDIALHALSLHENRDKFLPILWTVHGGDLVSDAGRNKNQVLKQIWFPGAHSDVGGGYERHEPADIALFWMAGEIKQFIDLDLDFLRQSAQKKPETWGMSQPHNAYGEQNETKKELIGPKTRLDNGQITSDSVFHSSLYASPKVLRDPKSAVTLDTLNKTFGEGWRPRCPELNEFETFCKTEWGTVPTEGTVGPVMFESASDLFNNSLPALIWVAASKGMLPKNCIHGGHARDGSTIYVARAFHRGGIHPGKAYGTACWFPYDGKEIRTENNYEFLTGHNAAVKWVHARGAFDPVLLGDSVPVQAGYEAHGEHIYVAQARIGEGVQWHCGKVKPGLPAMIPYDGKEQLIQEYRVMVYG